MAVSRRTSHDPVGLARGALRRAREAFRDKPSAANKKSVVAHEKSFLREVDRFKGRRGGKK